MTARLMERAWANKTAWKLANENWNLCREIVDLRDGHRCIIPGCGRTEDLQLDHCISRMCRIIFFETDLLQYLCPEHHNHKSFRKGQWVDLTVRAICEARLGKAQFDDYVFLSKEPCRGWKNVWWQEKINQKLKRELEALKGGAG